MNTERSFPVASIVTVITFVLLVAGSVLAADRSSQASAPMRVVEEGLTVEQQLAKQVELSNRLLNDLPSTAAAIQIPFSAEDAAAVHAAKSIVPLKIGAVKEIPHRIKVRGRDLTPTRDGGRVWGAVFNSNNAGAIRLHVEDMGLPAKAELYIYSRNGQAYGPYTGSGEVWTATIFGSEAILQLHVSSAAGKLDKSSLLLRVKEAGVITPAYANGTEDIFQAKPNAPNAGWPCGNPNCVVDASCRSQEPANTLKLAVAKMEWVQGRYIYTCTGGLLTDNNPSQNNFFLTANHCVSKNNNAGNTNFYWRFATSSCNASSCPSNNGWPYQTQGSTVSATGRRGDFTLLHLNTAPPAGSRTLGWLTSPVANNNGLDLFRVSNPNFGPQVYSAHDVDTAAPTCSSWPRGERIYSRDTVGAIDGGSSGSPVTNLSGQVVGQLSGTCGTNPSDPCSSGPGEANATVDGAFAYYYPSIQQIINP